jgi:hypothetical protein
VRIRLILQLACTLLDRGDAEMAMEISQPILVAPTRAAGIAPAGWLRLAIATRVHLPAGSGEAASMLLREAVYSTDHYGLHALTARLWLELAQLEERLGRPSEAIECLHRSRAAEHVHARARRQALGLLSGEFGAGQQAPVDLDEVLAVDVKRAVPAPVHTPALVRPAGGHRAPEVLPVPELQLAPAPAAEPAPRVALVREPEPPRFSKPAPERAAEPAPTAPEPPRFSKPASEPPAKPAPAATVPSSVRWERSRAKERSSAIPAPPPTTRHDSDHGSVAAKSVLDRLGISSGGGGGRRRAADESAAAPAAPLQAELVKVESVQAEPVKPQAVKPEPSVEPPLAPEPSAPVERLTDDEYRDQVADPWLPRLRMPPSLEPLGDSNLGWTPSGTTEPDSAHGRDGGNTDLSSPFSESYARAIAEDEPPPDAGLAELLARALAEHQAGTASAAALVKRLGSQGDEPAASRPVNGHSRSAADGPDNGRHRTGQ